VLYLQRRFSDGMFSDEDRGCAEIFVEHLAPLAHGLLERVRRDAANDLTRPYRGRLNVEHVIGSSRALADLFRELELVAPLDVCVLLTGDTGSGKSQIARVIHANSPRAAGPFVEINCAALPEPLMESELFGALAGAHSTATRKLDGKVTVARGGTLFLDEIGDLATIFRFSRGTSRRLHSGLTTSVISNCRPGPFVRWARSIGRATSASSRIESRRRPFVLLRKRCRRSKQIISESRRVRHGRAATKAIRSKKGPAATSGSSCVPHWKRRVGT
jgi:hypothetical protein